MPFIRRYIWDNIIHKKGRTALIIFAIIISTAAFFTAMGLSSSIKQTYIKMIRNSVGSSDLLITASDDQKDNYGLFHKKKLREIEEKLEYSISEIDLIGVYEDEANDEDVAVSLMGIDYNELMTFNPQILLSEIESLNKDQIIISKQTAEKYGFKLGDTFKVSLNSKKVKYTIVAIANDSGIFTNEVAGIKAIVSIEDLKKRLAVSNMVSKLYLKIKPEYALEDVKLALEENYNNCNIDEAVDQNAVAPLIFMVSSSFMMILMLIFLMSVFIIYSAFKVIMKERLSVIGTFRSVGATKKQIIRAFFKESVGYGIVGGILGDVVGIAILQVIAVMTNPYKDVGIEAEVSFSGSLLMMSFIVAVILTVCSAIFPILQISKISIKNIIIGNHEGNVKTSIWKYIFAVVSILSCIFVLDKLPKGLAFMLGSVILICAMIGFVILIPLIVQLTMKVFGKIFPRVFGFDALVATNNIVGNKTLLNNISILVISVASVIVINLSIYSAGNQISNNFNHFIYDVVITSEDNDRHLMKSVGRLEGVDGIYGVYRKEKIKDLNTGKTIIRLEGIDTDIFLEYIDVGVDQATLETLNEGKNILLGDVLSYSMGLGIGDEVLLDMENGEMPYTVTGIFDSNYIRSGLYALISEDNFANDMRTDQYEEIWLKTDKKDLMIKTIKDKFVDKNPSVMSKEALEEENLKFNEQIDKPMSAFAVFSLLIGVFGILNNFLISFIERKHSLAIYRSIGMSVRQTKKVLLLEAVIIGVVGSGVAIVLALVILPAVPILTRAMGSPLMLSYSPNIFIMYFICGVLINCIASLVCVRKVKDLNIVAAIKVD